jgi:serine/threonine-protein kinase
MLEQVSSYRLEEEIARGGMGIVYRGVHTVFDEVVAIKAIYPELTINLELRQRFLNEAKIQRRLQHPNIVQIREFLIDQGKFYIVMEFIEGETLTQHLRQLGRPMLASEAIPIFRQALEGVGFAHSQGVIHRDIKPSNIMLTRQGVAKLTDFGIARSVDMGKLTRTGTALGTPAYMSPEQIQGTKLDYRTDIYSLGITLYEMLTGRVPFERPGNAENDYPVLQAHIDRTPVPPRQLVPEIPPFLEVAILKAIEKPPEGRFASCHEFQAAMVPSPLPATRVATVPRPEAGEPKIEPPERKPDRKRTEAARMAKARLRQERLARDKAELERALRRGEERAEAEQKAEQARLDRQKAEAGQRAMRAGSARDKDEGERAGRDRLAREKAEGGQKKKTLRVVAVGLFALVIVSLAALAWVYWGSPPNRQIPAPAGEVRENPKDGLKYAWIPPGTFTMGCSPGDNECYANERPSHQVTISKGFWIGQTEVTVGAYKRFAKATGRQMPPAPEFNSGWTKDNMPVVSVSWNDAHDYCAWAGGRLPTEAEWEYAARGGSRQARYGNVGEIAWYSDNSGDRAHEVAQKRPNGLGLFDMLGNVLEWVDDWYDDKYYQNSPSQDPGGPASGQYRVLRGACWAGSPRDLRVSYRVGEAPDVRYNLYLGLRCGRELAYP